MPISDLLAQITGEPSPSPRDPIPTPKRKPTSTSSDPFRPSPNPQRPTSTTANSSRPINPSSSRPDAKTKPITSTFKNGQPTPPPTDGASSLPAKPPKKGSFAEIMARGKANQATRGQVGKIQHKRIEKQPSKREREDMKAQKGAQIQKNIGPGGKFKNGLSGSGRPGTKINGKAPEPEKKVKKAAMATTGYAGTARPRPGAGGMSKQMSGSRPSSAERYDRGGAAASKRYTYASEDEEEEDEMEEEDGYVSSDMEAAAFEVDEEEEMAGRIARREDAEALKEENRAKREKEEKKRRLMAMAAKARR